MQAIEYLIAVIFFVASGGFVFTQRLAKSRFARACTGIVAFVSLCFLIPQVRDFALGSINGLSRQQHPGGDEAAWQEASAIGSRKAYELYMSAWPAGGHVTEAKASAKKLDDDAAWLHAKSVATNAAYESYISTWTDGLHIGEARNALSVILETERASQYDNTAWGRAKSEGSEAAFESYLRTWPNGLHAYDARNQLAAVQATQRAADDEASWVRAQSAGSGAAYASYLQNWPNGAHALEAHSRLAVIDQTLQAKAVSAGPAWTIDEYDSATRRCRYTVHLPPGPEADNAKAQAMAACDARRPPWQIDYDAATGVCHKMVKNTLDAATYNNAQLQAEAACRAKQPPWKIERDPITGVCKTLVRHDLTGAAYMHADAQAKAACGYL